MLEQAFPSASDHVVLTDTLASLGVNATFVSYGAILPSPPPPIASWVGQASASFTMEGVDATSYSSKASAYNAAIISAIASQLGISPAQVIINAFSAGNATGTTAVFFSVKAPTQTLAQVLQDAFFYTIYDEPTTMLERLQGGGIPLNNITYGSVLTGLNDPVGSWTGASTGTISIGILAQPVTTFNVTALGGIYYMNNQSTQNPIQNLLRGSTYKFVIAALGHPFWIQNVSTTQMSPQPSYQYNVGVTNNGKGSCAKLLKKALPKVKAVRSFFQSFFRQSFLVKLFLKACCAPL